MSSARRALADVKAFKDQNRAARTAKAQFTDTVSRMQAPLLSDDLRDFETPPPPGYFQ